MSDPRRSPETELDASDAELVRRIAEHYLPRDPSAAARVAFRAGLDARIRRRARLRLWIAGVATAAAGALFVLLRGSPPAPLVPSADAASDAALLVLALPDDSEEESLPADYQAIDDLFLEGEGV
jgi:hypothetical protein